jgi:hypothetical protein
MNTARTQLAAALRERLQIIADETSRRDPEGHSRRLQAASERIDALAKALPAPVEPQLAHYLARCSYEKALRFLEAPPENA